MRWIEGLAQRWLTYWHGNGEAHQYRYYRCEGCRHLVPWTKIRTGGCTCGLSNRIRPAVLSWRDKARCLLVPWLV